MRDSVDGNRRGDTVRARVQLIPYCRLKAGWSISENVMRELWRTLEHEGTAHSVFQNTRDWPEFLNYMQAAGNFPVAAADEEGIAALAWLNNVEGNSAFCHHVFMRRTWGRRTLEIASDILDYWFALSDSGGAMFDVLIGATPGHLRLAQRFAQKLGFTLLSPMIPQVGNGDGLVVSFLERETWEKAAAAAADK